MEAIAKILAVPSRWRGSENTAAAVRDELRLRFDSKVAEEYRPELCRSYREWRKIQYAPKPGEKAIKVITIVEERNEKNEVVRKFPRVVNLFNINQVHRIR